MAFLAVSVIKQKDHANAVGGALQHAIIMRYMLEADQTEQGARAADLLIFLSKNFHLYTISTDSRCRCSRDRDYIITAAALMTLPK